MVRDFNFFDTMSFFVITNFVFTFISTYCLIRLFQVRRYVFIKPSIVLLSYTNIFLQWPAAIFSGYYEAWLPNPYTMMFLIHGYVLIGLAGSISTMEEEAKNIWNKTRLAIGSDHSRAYLRSIIALTAVLIFVLILYLLYVPITSTGLYAILFDPLSSGMAREESLKLLENRGVIYAFSIMTSSIAPLLMGLLTMVLIGNNAINKAIKYPGSVFIIILTAIAVSLTGARSGLFNMIVVVCFVILWKKGFSIHPVFLVLLAFFVLSPAIIMTLLREGIGIEDFSGLYFSYMGSILNRIFFMPFHVGCWYMHYAQENGPLGIGAIPKLAKLLRVEPLDGPNIIGLIYGPQYYGKAVLGSISATSGYLFGLYGYFGIISFPISLLALWLTDISVYLYRRLELFALIPCLASINLSTLMFVQSDYTVVILTHGFALILLLSLALSYLGRVGYFDSLWRSNA